MAHLVSAFKEYKSFEAQRPWSVIEMKFPRKVYSPPHYADTIEILLCEDLCGNNRISGASASFGGKQVFFIPPDAIHSMEYQKDHGWVRVIKLYPDGLKRYCNLQTILADSGRNYDQLPTDCSVCWEEAFALANLLASPESSAASCLASILCFFEGLLALPTEKKQERSSVSAESNARLHAILEWTEQHYAEKLTVDEVAVQIGYSKNYFCNMFKANTGVTYMNYLNSVRVTQSCKLLRCGLPMNEISEQCGFSNASYYIQRFKQIMGTTPYQYKKNSLGR